MYSGANGVCQPTASITKSAREKRCPFVRHGKWGCRCRLGPRSPRSSPRPMSSPDDRTAVERVIREEGVEMARCRTGQLATPAWGRLSGAKAVPEPGLVRQPGTVELA